jgi:nucleoside-triphosphatase THEP1
MDIDLPGNDLPLLFPLSQNGTILVVTGWRGVGKTTYCQKAVEQYQKAGLKVSGLLSPGRFENGQKNGIFAIDLSSHESRLAASLIPGEMNGLRFGPWTFDANVFEWGNQRLLQMTSSDVLVIDELGYLEFDLKTGWSASFELLHRKKYQLAIVVIRPECIDAFANMGFNFQIKQVLSPQPPSHLTP